MKGFVPLALLFTFVLVGCLSGSGEKIDPPPVSGQIYPLGIGNSWVWQVSKYRFDGQLTEVRFDSMRVVDTIRINGEKWFQRRYAASNLSFAIVDTITLRSTGFFLYISAVGGARLFYKYPGALSEETVFLPYTIIIESNDLTQEFPIGVLQHCYVYRVKRSDRTTVSQQILSPNVGFVKETVYDSTYTPAPGTYVSQRTDLLSYNVH